MRSIRKQLILLLLLVIFSTYTPKNNKYHFRNFFPLKKIIIENNLIVNELNLIKELSVLKGKNLIKINQNDIKNIIKKFEFINSAQIKKIYPSTLKINIKESKIIAIIIKKKKKYYLTESGQLKNFVELKNFETLPFVFGNEKFFFSLYKKLIVNNFPLKDIKSYYYFDIGRWDIIFKNDKIVKLPVLQIDKVLKGFMKIKNDDKFNKYNIFDYRIKNQLILK